jgi:hypothetical protein
MGQLKQNTGLIKRITRIFTIGLARHGAVRAARTSSRRPILFSEAASARLLQRGCFSEAASARLVSQLEYSSL